jgi:integrase
MNNQKPTVGRVTGHLKLADQKTGPVWYTKTRVPGRTPEQTTRRLAPAHLHGGKPPAGALTRRQAQDALDDLLAAERRKVGQRAYAHGPATFADAAAGYLHHVEHVLGRERATLRDYRGSIDTYLSPRWGETPVDAVTPDHVERLRDELAAAGLSPRTVVRHLTVAHGVFKHAMRRHGLERNPASADLVDRPTVRYSGEFVTLDSEQLAALVRAAADTQDAAMFLTAAQTGMRQGELRALRWMDVDFAADRIHVCRSATVGSNATIKAPKSGRVRSVPMVPAIATALAKLSHRPHFTADDDLVFGNDVGEVQNDELLRRRYYRALKTAGLPRIRFHDLRHAFGSTAVKAFPLSDVQAMLGHAHVTTTMRYVHHRPGADDAARLAAGFGDDSVSREMSPTGDIQANSAQLSDTKSP